MNPLADGRVSRWRLGVCYNIWTQREWSRRHMDPVGAKIPENIQFEIDWVPPTLNEYSRAHWARQRKWVEVAAAHVLSKVGRGRIDPKSADAPRRRVTIEQYRKRQVDYDNLSPKVLMDALKKLGHLKDDGPAWCEQVIRPVQVDFRRPRTRITIEDL